MVKEAQELSTKRLKANRKYGQIGPKLEWLKHFDALKEQRCFDQLEQNPFY